MPYLFSYRGKGELTDVFQTTGPSTKLLSSWQSLIPGEKSCNIQSIRHKQEIPQTKAQLLHQ